MSRSEHFDNNRLPFQHTKWSNKPKKRQQKLNEEQEQETSSPSTSQWKSPPYPLERWGHQAVVLDKYLYLVGGYIEETYPQPAKEQMYRLDCEIFEWERVNCREGTKVPVHRDSHTMCSLLDTAYLFGGKIGDEQVLNDCWKMEVKNQVPEWTEIIGSGQIPQARESAQLCSFYDRYILLFGGTNGKEEDDLVVFDDMYVLDTKTQVWAEITDKRGAVLEARDSFGMTEVNGIVYIFGGQGRSVGNEDVFYSELFRLKFITSNESGEVQFVEIQEVISNNEEKKPCGRASNSICVFKNRYIFIVGGEKGEEVKLDDVWAFDILENIWIEVQHKRSRPPNLKPLISHSSQVYKDNIIVFGGMYKETNKHSDQTLVLSLNYPDSDSKKSQTSISENKINLEDLTKIKVSDNSLKSAQFEEDSSLVSSHKQDQESLQNQVSVPEKPDSDNPNLENQQNNEVELLGNNSEVNQQNNKDNQRYNPPSNVIQDNEDKQEQIIIVENEGDEDENIVIAVGSVQEEVQNVEDHQIIIEDIQDDKNGKLDYDSNRENDNKNSNNQNRNNNEIEIEEDDKFEEKNDEKQVDKNEDFDQENEAIRESQEKLLQQERDSAQRNKAKKEALNNQSSQPQQQLISDESILQIKQPQVSMSFISAISNLIPSPLAAFGLFAQNAKIQSANIFQINLMFNQKKDNYVNTSLNKHNQPQQEIPNSKVNGQLLNKAIDRDISENYHLFFQLYDDGIEFSHSEFLEILFKFDNYQPIPYSKVYKEFIVEENDRQTKVSYGNNLKLAGLRLGQSILFISKNKVSNILNVGLITSNGKVNPCLDECILFVFSFDTKRRIFLTEAGDQNKRIILNNIAHLMNEEQLFRHDKGNYVYIFDLKRIPQKDVDGYEFQYSPQKSDILAKKRCLFGEKKDQVEKLVDYSLKSYIQHLYCQVPENKHFFINQQRYEFVAYPEILRRQKGMRILRELNTETEVFKALGKVTLYEIANYSSSDNQQSLQAATNSPSLSDKPDIEIIQSKAEGATTRKNTSPEFHQGILFYFDDRLIGRAEASSFGQVFIEKIVNKSKNQPTLFKYVGIVELDKYFTPNIFFTGFESSYQEDYARSNLKSFIKSHRSQQGNKNEKDKNDKIEKLEKPRLSNQDNSEEPELRKEVKID